MNHICHYSHSCRASFRYTFSDFVNHFWVLVSNLSEKSSKRPLGAHIGLKYVINIFFFYKFVRELVQRVIRKVHVNILEVLWSRLFVLCCAEPGKAFIGKEGLYLALIDASNNYIDPEIKLEAIQKHRVLYVVLHDHFFRSKGRDLPQIFEKSNVISLTPTLGLAMKTASLCFS